MLTGGEAPILNFGLRRTQRRRAMGSARPRFEDRQSHSVDTFPTRTAEELARFG
jgi:hypothetical protein